MLRVNTVSKLLRQWSERNVPTTRLNAERRQQNYSSPSSATPTTNATMHGGIIMSRGSTAAAAAAGLAAGARSRDAALWASLHRRTSCRHDWQTQPAMRHRGQTDRRSRNNRPGWSIRRWSCMFNAFRMNTTFRLRLHNVVCVVQITERFLLQ